MMNMNALRRHLEASISENQVKLLDVVVVPWLDYSVPPFAWFDECSQSVIEKEDISSTVLKGLTLAFRDKFGCIRNFSGSYDGSPVEHGELEALLKANVQWVTYDAKNLYFGLFGERIYLDWDQPIFDIRVVASLLLLGRTKVDPHLPSIYRERGQFPGGQGKADAEMVSVSSLSQWLLKDSGATPTPSPHPQLTHIYVEKTNAERTASQLVPLYEALNKEIPPRSRAYIETVELPSVEANAWIEWVGVRICDYDFAYLRGWFKDLGPQSSNSRKIQKFISDNKWLLSRPLQTGVDARVHPIHTQNAAATGRSSFKRPKLQYIPKPLRALVQASPGNLILEVDFSSFDFAIAAAIFSDQEAIDSCTNGDPFSESIGGFDRNQMKHAVQIWIHGGRESTLKKEMGITSALSAEVFRTLALRYPRINEGLKGIETMAREKRMIEISKGVVRSFPSKESSDLWMSSSAIASVLQGNGAMILKQAVYDVYKIYRGSSTLCILTNHDSVLIETPREIAKETREEVQYILTQAAKKHLPSMPAKTKWALGVRWGKRSDMKAFQVV
ncbi:MAG TPA: DNA polymerase [Oligoflexus sp.]|uniref:DNA polymerase n=1 Tax=Oligoflexus sp. TaxID=1971216 RepID=UPI002D4C5468|nr:DNA polymerase [Oligoflexus sp.]HYX34125.1 DNA polymerase [Oligoflexus sp.]